MAKGTAATPIYSKGDLIAQLVDVRDQKRELQKQVDDLSEKQRNLESQIIEDLKSDDLTQSSTSAGTVTLSSQQVPSVQDWDKFNAFVKRNNAFYLYQRRVNSAPYRELLAERKGRAIPGVETVTVEKLNLRKKS